MTKKVESSGNSALSAQPDAGEGPEEMMAHIPDFTPKQWAWLQGQTRELEVNFIPTRSLIPGL